MSRLRRFATALAAAALFAGCAGAFAQQVPPATAPAGLTVFQINDTYKIEGLEAGRVGGLARLRTLRKAVEAEGRPVLVVHGGDLLFPSVMSKYLAGESMVAAFNLLDGGEGFDDRLFVTFGNHEFDHRDVNVLMARLAESRFTWLSANLCYRLPGMAAPVPLAGHLPNVVATRLIEVGGVKVGLFGLTLPGEPREWADYGDYERLVAAAASSVAELRARGAEFVIALTHQELPDDQLLAKRVPGIDWIAGGHEHIALERHVGSTWITKADADARTVVRIDVDRTPAGLVASHRLIEMAGGVAPDPELQGVVASWLVRLERLVEQTTGKRLLDVVATTEHALEGVEPKIRGRETALGDFLADILRERLATDLAFVNGGAIRVNDDVPAGGDVRVYELEGIFYFDNKPVAFELTGAELLDMLRRSVSQAAIGHGRFLQVSGIRFEYHARPDPDGGEVTRVELGEVQVQPRGGAWQPLDRARRYSVATLDWIWKNGCRDGYARLAGGCGGASPVLLERPELSWRGITEEAIARLPERRIRADIDGRIVRLQESNPGGER
jgi:5'-nucleotidase